MPKRIPECRLCGHAHLSYQPHKLIGGPEPSKAVKALAQAPTVEVMDATAARALTDRIKSAAGELWRLLEEAHRQEAWRLLGYESWTAYVDAEFDFSKRRAYQLVNYGRFAKALETGSVKHAARMAQIPEAAIREPETAQKVAQAIKRGGSPRKAIDQVTGAPCEHPRTVAVIVCADCGKRVE